MSTTVWKFPFKIDDIVKVEMPLGAVILYIDSQGETPCIWARVDPEAPKETRIFRFAGTGHPLGDEVGNHVGSFQMMDGRLVWHVFEVKVRKSVRFYTSQEALDADQEN